MNTSQNRRRLLIVSAAAGLGSVASTSLLAQTQTYPVKPITLIVPWPAGGASDRHMRLLAELAGKQLGQNIVVENKPGAGGSLGPSC